MEKSLELHYQWRGKIETGLRSPLNTKEDLSMAYTPGVALPCIEIKNDPSKSFELTSRWNTVAVITDGSAVLGLGDIGPLAAMPVMEGKAALFKKFGNVDAIPLCIDTKDVDTFVDTICLIAGSFGGINLEDISAPRCFEIEKKLKERLDIPVFHDDQHGTAIVVLAAVENAMKLIEKTKTNVKIVVNGAGAAGTAITELLLVSGYEDITVCDKMGVLDCITDITDEQKKLAKKTNPRQLKGSLSDAMIGSDIFIGVSAPDVVSYEMVKSMNDKPVVFAMANPTPEIMPDIAKKAGAYITGTGRSDFANQVNNLTAFPGIFRGLFDAGATQITEEMKIAAAEALANCIPKHELTPENITPKAFDKSVADAVAKAVYKICIEK